MTAILFQFVKTGSAFDIFSYFAGKNESLFSFLMLNIDANPTSDM